MAPTYTVFDSGDAASDAPDRMNENWRTGLFMKSADKSANFTVWADDSSGEVIDLYRGSTTSGDVTASLPAANSTDAAAGRVVWFKRYQYSPENEYIVSPDGSDTIDTLSGEDYEVAPGECVGLRSDGASNWDIVGRVRRWGAVVQITSGDSPYTLPRWVDLVECDCTGGAITVNLPSAISGELHRVIKTDSGVNAVTIDGDGTQDINGSTTKTLSSQYDQASVLGNGDSDGWWEF